MAGQSGGQYFSNTIVNDNARVHMGNVHHHYANPPDDEATESSFRKALFITDPSVDRQSLIDKKGHRAAGTCEWLERNETYKAWLSGIPSLLWIFGGPGKGKTMLSIYLTQQFETLHSREAIYFFCSSEHPTRSTATAILRTLLWQMIVIRPKLTKLISPYFDPPERIPAMLSTPGSLWEIFAKIVQSAELGKMRCLIDGLDECDDESSRWLASQFAELSSQPNNISLHIVIASRHMSSVKHIKQVRLDPDNDQNVSDDIEKFASLKMKELSERLDLTTAFCSHIQSQLLAKAGGTFLWIGYAMVELSSKSTSLEVEEAVEELPTALPALYGRMLRRIPSAKLDLIVTLLHWVTLAVRPLFFDQLADVVTWHVSDIMNKGQVLRDYIKLCEPLIVVQQERVLLVHQSAKDYFLRDTKYDDMVAERVRASFTDAQGPLAKTCLGALGKPSSLSVYAAIHWPHHFSRCSETVQESLVKTEPFFGRVSASRDDWWQNWRVYWMVTPDEIPPRLHIACHVGLVVWAREILAEVSSLKSHPKRKLLGARPTPKDDLSDERQRNGVNYPFSLQNWTPLHYAIYAQHGHDVVSFMLDNGANPNVPNDIKVAPLAMAVNCNVHNDTLKLLLASGADIEGGFKLSPSVSLTPLRRAINLGREEMAVFLIASGADIRAADRVKRKPSSLTVLQIAASHGLKSVVRMLLEHGADPQAAQGASPIPLCLAIMHESTEVVDYMLGRLASGTTFHDHCASWPLHAALARRDTGLAKRIIRLGAVGSDFPTEPLTLWMAILDSNVADVISALKRGVNPNTPTPSSPGCPSGLASLHWAVIEWQHRRYNTFTMEQYGAIVRRLLEHGADASLKDAEGKTALQRAEAKGRVWAAMASLIAKPGTRVGSSLAGCNLDLLRTGGRR